MTADLVRTYIDTEIDIFAGHSLYQGLYVSNDVTVKVFKHLLFAVLTAQNQVLLWLLR